MSAELIAILAVPSIYSSARPELDWSPVCRVCLLFIHPRAPNVINLRSASTMPA